MKNQKNSEISEETIIEAAIGILKRDGLEKLTMRSLAGALGIKAASLYWHIKDKQVLYGQIAEHLCREIRSECSIKDAKAYLMEGGALFRQKLLEVPDSVQIFMHSVPNTPCRFGLIKNILICLLHLGVKEENCLMAGNMFNNYILSFVADEIIMRVEHRGINPFAGILGTAYEQPNNDEQFARGLEVLFTGFETLR
jgi:AcrR family transcriptional regulator